MRIAIVSDIHSNLEALEKTLEVVKQKNIDEIVCLGDIVGYGANPNECISLIRQHTGHILLGNHDEAAVNLQNIHDFNPYAQLAAAWTHKTLTNENKKFIQSLPFTAVHSGLLFVHASPFEPKEWHYIISPEDHRHNFSYFSEPICFFGHSHYPGIFNEELRESEILPGKKYLVNVGSVGQPRDHNWRLSFGIFDTETWKYENVRSEYDVNTASEKILRAGLPKPLAERILVGR